MIEKPLYTYGRPYVYRRGLNPIRNRRLSLLYRDTMSEKQTDLQNLSILKEILAQWCVRNNLIVQNEVNLSNTLFGTFIYTTNFRSANAEDNYDKIIEFIRKMSKIEDTIESDKIFFKFMELAVQIGTVVPIPYLNKHITCIFTGLGAYSQADSAHMSWEQIHCNIPYFWLLYDLHLTLVEHT
jgi:hypothetical protein